MPKTKPLVTCTIDGKQISVPEGTLVIEAARLHGIDVPNFCYEPSLRPWGSCRMCMIEVHGKRGGIVEGCSTPLREGMEVSTHSPASLQARQDMLRFFLIDHALDCPVCDKSGECRLQDSTFEYNVYNNPFRRPKRAEEMRTYSPLISYKLDRCVVCSQCTRVCEEIVGATAITMADRGYYSEVVPAFGNSLADTKCTHCGNCVAVCPVGALLDRAYTDHEWKMDHTRTVCHYCAVGCTIDARTIGSEVKRIDGTLYEGVNRGYLCVKGRWGYNYTQDAERITTPLIRRGDRFDPASWDEALNYTAMRLADYRDGDFMGVGSTKVTTEEGYLFQLFTRVVMGTNNLDTAARYSNAPGQQALAHSFGLAATTNDIHEIRDMKCLLIAGANMPETHAIASYWVNIAVRTHGDPAALIVIDPHWNLLCDVANLWLKPRPGTDGALLNAMARVILDGGLANQAFIDARTEDFAAWQASLAEFSVERAAEITGVPAEQIVQAARLYATGNSHPAEDGALGSHGPSAAFFGNGLTQQANGVDSVLALNNLALLTGNVGREYAGVNTFVGDNNTQGAADMGLAPDLLPGYVPVGDNEARMRFEELWLSRWAPRPDGPRRGARPVRPLPTEPGLTLSELPAALRAGGVKALFIQGEDLVGTAPNRDEMEQALERAEFVVVQDLFLTETAQLADVILPASSGFEKDGSYTNLERRVQRVRKAVPTVTGRADWQALVDLAARFGYDLPFRHPAQIMDEIARVVPAYAGINYERLEADGLKWPVPSASHPGTPTLYLDSFATASGKARFIPAQVSAPPALLDSEFPLILQVAASLNHWDTGDRTRRSVGPRRLEPMPFIDLSVADAARLGLRDGGMARVSSRRGTLDVRARVVESLTPGLVRMTPHFPREAPFNRLTGEPDGATGGAPTIKFTPVRVEPALAPVPVESQEVAD